MLRTFCHAPAAGYRGCFGAAVSHAVRACVIQMPKEQRDIMTKALAVAREEAKGQALDLSDMSDAARGVARNLQESLKKVNVADDKFKGKTTTINASLKAYNTRLSNLQSEARAIQNEIDSLMKLMWGTQTPAGAPGSTAAGASTTPEANETKPATPDFDCDVPPIAQRLEQINKSAPQAAETPAQTKPAVEVVEGEVIRGGSTPKSSSTETPAQEIEIESIEIEVEGDASPPPSGNGKADAAASVSSPADTMSITDITKDLYERGVNFADCLDAQSLRRRYRDVLEGRFATQKPTSTSAPRTEQSQSAQPPPPPRAQMHQQQYQQQSRTPNTSETGLANDPYPNAHRKMIDPMKYVWEVKQELSKEKNIDPNSVDLWSGKIRLEDHKRLYDYPTIQNYPIEVRQKGDVPR